MRLLHITELLESRLSEWADENGIPISTDNIQFENKGGVYLTSHILPAQTDSIDLAGDTRIYRGVYQVNVIYPAGKGKSDALKIAGQICNLFPLNLSLSGGMVTCFINSVPSEHPAIQSDTTYSIPVRMSYRSDN